jgi:hypothetical protein
MPRLKFSTGPEALPNETMSPNGARPSSDFMNVGEKDRDNKVAPNAQTNRGRLY